jgi:hypothetical protein
MYVHMLRRVVRNYRETKLIEGTVRFDSRHPLRGDLMAGDLVPRELQPRGVRAVLPEWAVKAHARPDGSLEVLVAHAQGQEYSPIVGIRPSSPSP